jgi:hypothetical protein
LNIKGVAVKCEQPPPMFKACMDAI